jgi:signal transduction histidine kinase
LMGWLEVLGDGREDSYDQAKKDDLVRSTVDNMQIDVDRLQRVANRFGLIGSRPELEACNLNELVQEAVDYYRRRLPFQGQGIQIHFDPGDLPPVPANPELFGWALENLIKNALQAVDPSEGRVKLKTVAESGGDRVSLELQDNGRGIPAPAARKIFRPGFTTKKRGWGMGLTLVKRIIDEYHRGRVELERSKPGETVFKITLPAHGTTKG